MNFCVSKKAKKEESREDPPKKKPTRMALGEPDFAYTSSLVVMLVYKVSFKSRHFVSKKKRGKNA